MPLLHSRQVLLPSLVCSPPLASPRCPLLLSTWPMRSRCWLPTVHAGQGPEHSLRRPVRSAGQPLLLLPHRQPHGRHQPPLARGQGSQQSARHDDAPALSHRVGLRCCRFPLPHPHLPAQRLRAVAASTRDHRRANAPPAEPDETVPARHRRPPSPCPCLRRSAARTAPGHVRLVRVSAPLRRRGDRDAAQPLQAVARVYVRQCCVWRTVSLQC